MGASPTPDATADTSSSPPLRPNATAEAHPPSPPIPAGILIYDGDCGFCSATARWAERRLSRDYQVISSQDADLASLGLADDDVARSAWWINPDGSRWDDHRSMAGALRAMSGLWPVIGRLLTLGPISPLARWVYRKVADNRYRIRRPGTRPTCNR